MDRESFANSFTLDQDQDSDGVPERLELSVLKFLKTCMRSYLVGRQKLNLTIIYVSTSSNALVILADVQSRLGLCDTSNIKKSREGTTSLHTTAGHQPPA